MKRRLRIPLRLSTRHTILGVVLLVSLPILGYFSSGNSSPLGSTTADTPVFTRPAGAHTLRVVTFNTGSGATVRKAAVDNGGFGPEQAQLAARWYGNGLAWLPVVEDVRDFAHRVRPDVVGLQEIFHAPRCTEIPPRYHTGFFCENWQPGDAGVARYVLGDDYQIACHRGKDDKCLAVRRDVGAIKGCDSGLCLDHLDGFEVESCGRGSRLGGAEIELAGGGTLKVVHVHATSGIGFADAACRGRQFSRLIEHVNDGAGTSGRSLLFGDFNTDPARARLLDAGARRLAAGVRAAPELAFVTEVGFFARPTFQGFLNIDHVIAGGYTGECWAAGISEGRTAVTAAEHFDHAPIVCDLLETPRIPVVAQIPGA